MPVACWHSIFCLLPVIFNLSSSVRALKLSQSSILEFRRSIFAYFETHGIMISVKLDACDRRLVGAFESSISGTCVVPGETDNAHRFVILKPQGKTNGYKVTNLIEVHKISCFNVGRSLLIVTLQTGRYTLYYHCYRKTLDHVTAGL